MRQENEGMNTPTPNQATQQLEQLKSEAAMIRKEIADTERNATLKAIELWRLYSAALRKIVLYLDAQGIDIPDELWNALKHCADRQAQQSQVRH